MPLTSVPEGWSLSAVSPRLHRVWRLGLVALGVLQGCGGSESRHAATGNEGAGASDSAESTSSWAPQIVDGPRALPVGPHAPLSWRLELSTDRPTTVSAELVADGETLHRRWDEPATDHVLPLVGLLPETRFELTVRVQDEHGETSAETSLTTEGLPFPWPTLEVLAHAPDRMDPGLTLMPLQAGEQEQFVGALDEQLRWRFVLRTEDKVNDVRLEGDDLWLIAGSAVERRDLLGEVLGRWQSAPEGDATGVDVEGDFHHEVIPGDEGFLTLTRRSVEVDDYPSVSDPLGPGNPATLMVPEIVEVALDGTVTERVRLDEVLDVRRVAYDSDTPSPMGLDWGHGNAVIPDGPEHWIVSLRHQDALVRLARDGTVDWILANPDGWPEALADKRLAPTDPELVWPFHQHAPERLEDGGLLVFDNGNYRSTPYGPLSLEPQYSRLVVFDVDAEARTVATRWTLDVTPTTGRLFSFAMGDADSLPNGNVLAVYGHLAGEAGVPNAATGRGDTHARLLEVDPETGEAVLDIRLSSRAEVVPLGWRVYRAQRIEGLHASILD